MYQLSIFPDESQKKEQKRLLQELIDLKYGHLFEKELQNFYGTPEEIQSKKREFDKKMSNFIKKVEKAFPGVM
ncbi:hypothetical protein P4S93_09620 [Aneurinibacillus thermoaerophilus]|uniref:hypothetical protein n=1 Tax=Aneurinibacillus thermoaerophilus TaxID=143495 RepID=UPI002E1EA439|nr:hypothetical protein [Aneurinibacillus thermoaerophilus]MED0761036.1 hypothetical protein [Aneurinibacillus thermoaerophilus]